MVQQQAMNRRTSRTFSSARTFELNPALGGGPNVRFGSIASIPACRHHVRLWGNLGNTGNPNTYTILILKGFCIARPKAYHNRPARRTRQAATRASVATEARKSGMVTCRARAREGS